VPERHPLTALVLLLADQVARQQTAGLALHLSCTTAYLTLKKEVSTLAPASNSQSGGYSSAPK
jgi:hypothetical protein